MVSNHLQKHLKKYQTYNINKAKSVVSVHLYLYHQYRDK